MIKCCIDLWIKWRMDLFRIRMYYLSRLLFYILFYISFNIKSNVIFDIIYICMLIICVIVNIVIVFMEMFVLVGMLFYVKIIRYVFWM